MANKLSPNVTKDGTTIHIDRCALIPSGVKADFVKHELKLTLTVQLDDSALAVRNDLAFLAFDETPLKIRIQPVQTQLNFPLGDNAVTLGKKSVTDDFSDTSDDDADAEEE